MTDDIVKFDRAASSLVGRSQVAIERERLITDWSITDEEFVGRALEFQGSSATWRDYEERVVARAVSEWAALVKFEGSTIGTGRPRECDLQQQFGGIATFDEVQLLLSMVRRALGDRLSPCPRCSGLRVRSSDVVMAITLLQPSLSWCGECQDGNASEPSSPPAGGIRSALARARAARLPATLTESEWEATLDHFDHRCAFCGGPWSLVEHATSIAAGGPTSASNCVPSCVGCNNAKRDRDLQGLDGKWDEARLSKIWTWLQSCGRPARNRKHLRRKKASK